MVSDQGVVISSERISAPLRKSSVSEPRSSQVVDLTKLPEEIRVVLADLDVNNDGKLSTTEISRAVELLKTERTTNRQLKKALCYAFLLSVILSVSNLVTSMVAEVAMRNIYVKESSLLPSGDSTSGRRLSSAYDELFVGKPARELISKSGEHLATAASHVAQDLKSDFTSPESLADLKYVKLHMANGVKHLLHVTGFTWHNTTDVDLYTSVGQTVHKTLDGMFLAPTNFAVSVEARNRRLQICGGVCDAVVAGVAVNAISAGASYAYHHWG